MQRVAYGELRTGSLGCAGAAPSPESHHLLGRFWHSTPIKRLIHASSVNARKRLKANSRVLKQFPDWLHAMHLQCKSNWEVILDVCD